jgi:hypothetical protein
MTAEQLNILRDHLIWYLVMENILEGGRPHEKGISLQRELVDLFY